MRRIASALQTAWRLLTSPVIFLWRILIVSSRFVFDSLRLGLYTVVYNWWMGYGDRPLRVIGAAAAFVLGFGILYYFRGEFVVDADSMIVGRVSFSEAIYYSLVSFTAVGYGSWVSEPVKWTRFLGAVESALGISTIALLVAVLLQWIRR